MTMIQYELIIISVAISSQLIFVVWAMSIYYRFKELKAQLEEQKNANETLKKSIGVLTDNELNDLLTKHIGGIKS
jgi:hypothetical protein